MNRGIENLLCPVCSGPSSLLDALDFNKCCLEDEGVVFGISGIPVHYLLCGNCGFCFAPEFGSWTLDEFAEKIYNRDYVLVDPDYVDVRPRSNAAGLISMFGDRAHAVRHLDYGGGGGLLARLLRESNWQSVSYDPFVNRDADIAQLGKFDLITAFEVFEHVPDVRVLMSNLRSLLAPDGIVLFSTLLSDGNIHANQKISWWYAAPRNGHISLFSKTSLATLAKSRGLTFANFSQDRHLFFTKIPPWAEQAIRFG